MSLSRSAAGTTACACRPVPESHSNASPTRPLADEAFRADRDIHANLSALEAVLADIATRPGVDATYHIGDLVGYAPWPDGTVERLRAASITGVAGNYDSTVAARGIEAGALPDELAEHLRRGGGQAPAPAGNT